VIVIKDELPMQSCMLSQPALADWKERSIYRGDQWWISRIKCVLGNYVPKERIETRAQCGSAIARPPHHGPIVNVGNKPRRATLSETM
jgi:hypothetical protein